MTARSSRPRAIGFVSLVGAGPGAPDLLTLRGADRLRSADAVVHDRLVDPGVFAHCSSTVVFHDLGKTTAGHGPRQEHINDLLVQLGRRGLRVVRLKGGDPFVFGRGGEEALALAHAGVPFEVVPGVSAALAAPLAAGIPLTHRGLASTFTVATGTWAGGTDVPDSELRRLATETGTLVLLMAVERLDRIVHALMSHGRRADEPAALVGQATRASQSVLIAPLGQIAARARAECFSAPAVFVLGRTVSLAATIGQMPVPHAHRVTHSLPEGHAASC